MSERFEKFPKGARAIAEVTGVIDEDGDVELDTGRFITEFGFDVLESGEMIDSGRWHVRQRSIFGKDGEFVAVSWSVGATEMQETEADVEVEPAVAEPAVRYIVGLPAA